MLLLRVVNLAQIIYLYRRVWWVGFLSSTSKTGWSAEFSAGPCDQGQAWCLQLWPTWVAVPGSPLKIVISTSAMRVLIPWQETCEICISSSFSVTCGTTTWKHRALVQRGQIGSSQDTGPSSPGFPYHSIVWNSSLEWSQLSMFGVGSR